ncbi:MAG: DUF2950 domain-containing protein [Planctomycetota bacterium]|jgi:hypothetical protein
MKTRRNMMLIAASLAGCLAIGSMAEAASGDEKTAKSDEAPATQKVFASVQDAVDALIAAFKDENESALLDIFGHDHENLIAVPDKVAQSEAFQRIYAAAQNHHELHEQGADQRILVIGRRSWPFPIPLVKCQDGWRFDTDAGAQEILQRRIGANELDTIDVCRIYASAQLEYAAEDRDGDEVREYAQRIVSTPGSRDGLYWDVDPESAEPLSPLGPLAADAAAYAEARRSAGEPIPYNGYYYKILTRQGENAPGGKYDYVINGNMIAGFALVAWPADYGSSGIMTFKVSHHGKLMEKDLGEKTAEIIGELDAYDPDSSWNRVSAD